MSLWAEIKNLKKGFSICHFSITRLLLSAGVVIKDQSLARKAEKESSHFPGKLREAGARNKHKTHLSLNILKVKEELKLT